MAANPPLAATREEKLAYVQALLEFARDDARQVYLRVTGALAVAALFVTQLPFGRLRALDRTWTLVLVAALGCLVVASFLYFVYVGATHNTRRRIARSLLDLDAVDATTPDDVLTHVWRTNRYLAFGLGDGHCGLGVLLLGAVLWKLLGS